MYAVAVSEHLHIEVGESLVAAVILRAHKAIELPVVEVCQFLLELRRLHFEPVGKTVSDFVDFGVRQLYCLAVRHLDVMSVFIFPG